MIRSTTGQHSPTTARPSFNPEQPQTREQALHRLSRYHRDPTKQRKIPGARTTRRSVLNYNIIDPSEGVRDVPLALKQDTEFQAKHTVDSILDFDRRLPHKQRLEMVEEITGVALFDPNKTNENHLENIRNQLTDDEILKILAFFGEEAFTEDGKTYLVTLFRYGWSTNQIPDDIRFDCDDTLVFSWHTDDLSLKGFAQAANHFIFKDKPSEFLSKILGEEVIGPTWGGYPYMTQMRPKAFHIARMLRHDKLMSIPTDSDREALYQLACDFPNFRAAAFGLLPYQKPKREDVDNNRENIFTTRDHAEKIEALSDVVRMFFERVFQGKQDRPDTAHLKARRRDRWIPKKLRGLVEKGKRSLSRRSYKAEDAPVFAKLPDNLKMSVAKLLFGYVDGAKAYKEKDVNLRNLNPDGTQNKPAKVMVDNNSRSGDIGLRTGTQSFIQILDRPPGVFNQVIYYGSTVITRELGALILSSSDRLADHMIEPGSIVIQAVAQVLADYIENLGTLNQFPSQNYSDLPLIMALMRVHSHDDPIFINLNAKELAEGVTGLHILRRRGNVRTYQGMRDGIEKNNKQSKAAIEELRRLFQALGEYEAIRLYYRENFI